ncbi:MAG: alpha-galactosidase [Acidobacteriota bacterium]
MNSVHRSLRAGIGRSAAIVLAAALFSSISARAADTPSASFDAATKTFRLDGGNVTYAFGVNSRNELESVYWGSRLQPQDALPAAHSVEGPTAWEMPESETPQEFAGWGQGLQWEPALKVTFPDGNRDLVLHYVSHTLRPDGVDVLLRDIERDVRVMLHYRIDGATGILARSAEITNGTTAKITLEQAEAGTYVLPHGTGYMLHYLTGRWASEWHMQTRPVTQGATILESRMGSTSDSQNPWFAIGRDGDVNENLGSVWFGELGWSGSWRITVEQDSIQQVRVTGGYNPFDFGYVLAPGASLTTPIFYAGHTDGGYGAAARLLHRFQITQILPGKPLPRPRPVLYNSWEATEFNVTEAGQESLAEKAASIGIERFVMDDGWFGQRKNDHAGLGDWYVNKDKFPNGLKPLIDKVHSLGMDFGIWVEPEMVNPDSDLYRAHPDWVLHFNGRPRTEGRNQMVLNLAIPEVRAYVFHFLDELVSHNDVAFLKWDYNRPWTEPGWTQVAPEDQKKVYVEAVNNVYSILLELRAKHPRLEIESCSSGGGRVDLGVLRFTDEVWPSDNTDGFDRLAIQEGFSYAYTPQIMMAWVTDVPNNIDDRTTSLEYRFLVAMQGALAVGTNLNKWTPEQFATAKQMIATYKTFRETIEHGSLYHLASSFNNSAYSAESTVSMDRKQAVLLAYLHSSQGGYLYPRLYLQGLDPKATYKVRTIDGKLAADTPQQASGDYWMHHGVDIVMRGDDKAAGFVFEQ